MQLKMTARRRALLGWIGGFALLVFSQSAWSISVSPSTSFDGSYTVTFGMSLGCTTHYEQGYYWDECYELEENANGGGWVAVATSGTSKAFSGKSAGSYQYRIYWTAVWFGVVVDEGVASSTVTATVSAPATPGTPSGPTGTEYDGAYTISWGAVTGAGTYGLQERLNGGSWSTIQNTSSTSKAVSGKTPGSWEYRVRAESAAGTSSYSGTKSVTVSAPATPGTPSGPGTDYDGAFTISWSSVTGAATYRLEERISSGTWSVIQNTSSLSKAVSGKTVGTWQYRVRAESGAGNSSYSGTKNVVVSAPATPATPTGPTGTEYDGAYTISWSAVTGATTYGLQERVNGGSWSTIQTSSSTSRAISGKTPGNWEYQVRAENSIGNSSYSSAKSVTVAAPATPGTPSGPSTDYDGSYTISWSGVTGAATYRLEERISAGSWSTIQNTSSTSKAISGKTVGVWEYRVRAESGAGNSSYTGTHAVNVSVPGTPVTPSGPSGTEYDGAYTISWSAVGGATSYRLDERPSGGSWATIQNTSSLSKAVSGKTPAAWEYRVRAENAIGNSAYSGTKSVTVSTPATPAAPNGPSSNYGGSYTVSWSSQTGATTYTLQERPSGGSWTTVYDGGSTSTGISSQSEGAWDYQVRACSAAGCSSYSAPAIVGVFNPPTYTSNIPGVVPGGFGVSSQGAATYTIPISVPAGTGGLRPGLALSYNHLAGNGLAGMRWTLSGISSITRCRQTYAQDGAVEAISYSSDDRYCLNGQRLVDFDGNYHADETEYRTEIESFQRIVQDGTMAGGGAESFYVDHGNGLRSYYGATSDSRVPGPGNTARTWYISSTVDQFGNTIEYVYDDTWSSEVLLESIFWTSRTIAPTLSPRYELTISYESRPTDDQRGGYDGGGASWNRSQRIDEIEVTYDDGQAVNTIATYDLTYESSSATGRSQLSEVSVCRGSDCLPETLFTVQDATPGWASMASAGASGSAYPLAGDWNGDGRTDLLVSISNEWNVFAGETDGTFASAVDTNISSTTNPDKARIIDFNGDGLSDLLYQDGSSNWKVAPSDGGATSSGFGSAIDTGISTSAVANPFLADVNGDGLADLVYQQGSSIVWYLNEGGSFPSSYSGILSGEWSMQAYSASALDSALRTLDANGDGRADLIVEIEDCIANPSDPEEIICNNDYYLLLASGNSFTWVTIAEDIPEGEHYTNFRSGDFNGDGLDDLLYLNYQGTGWIMKISTGTGLVSGSAASVPVTNAGKAMIADYDGDGRDDLIRVDTSHLYIHRSEGNTLPSSATVAEISSGVGGSTVFAADVTGSGYADIVRTSGSAWYIHTHDSDLADVVTDFTDGLGRTVSVAYESLAQSAAYTLDLDHDPTMAQAPYVRRFGDARYVVTTETHDDGIGGTRDFLHEYETAFVDASGRGWLSFLKHTIEDDAQGTISLTEYDQEFPSAGIAVSVEQRTVAGNKLIRSIDSTLPSLVNMALSGSTPPRQFPRVEQTTTVEKEVFGTADGVTLRTIVENPEYSTTYGYVTEVTRTVSGASTSWESVTDFDRVGNDIETASLYCIGLPGLVETSNKIGAGTPEVRKVDYAFNSDCSIDTVTDLSNASTSKQLETSYGYDAYGNVTSVSQDSVAGTSAARITTMAYDDDGQLPDTVTIDSSGLNLGTTLEWDYLLGLRTSVTGADGLETSFDYDAFGRLTKETRPSPSGADHTDYTYRECSVCFPQNAAYFVHVEDSAGSEQYTFFDHLQRPVGSETALLGGARSREEVQYLATGQLDQSSVPYITGDEVYWITYDYDGIGRLIEEDAPVSEAQGTGAVTAYAYLGLTLEVTDAEDHTTGYVHNALGQIETVVDALSGETDYTYHPFGELYTVTDNASNVTTITYDARGFKSQMIDPDMGTWAYDHNVFGELAWQEDARGQEIELYYDKAGRLDYRDAEGEVTNWEYYTSGTGLKGRLDYMEITGQNLKEEYAYSSVTGLLTELIRTIGTDSYEFDYAFDTHGRLTEMTYPENAHSTRFGVEYGFDSYGALSEVTDATTPSLVYWAQDSQDAFGRATQATLGNGLVEKLGFSRATGQLVSIETGPGQTATLQDLSLDWDMAGNLVERIDGNLSRTDVFDYDALSRLTDLERNSSSIFSVTYTTDHTGNIATKTGMTGTYTYGVGSGGPHAVTSIGSKSYVYDANGNMTSREGETIGWTVDNLPDGIEFGTDYTDFVYGPDRARWIQDGKEGSWTYTRHYAGAFDSLTWGTSDQVDTHYIFANGQAVAQWTTSNVQSDELQYLHRDHQGNVVATTDDAGDLLAEFEYDPFGVRTTTYGNDDDVPRGYTGHEHLNPVGLVHMNGRVQDPMLGRFVSADPLVQAPYYSQSLNRYSYVWNNPMSLVDPSGFQGEPSDDPLRCRVNMALCPTRLWEQFFGPIGDWLNENNGPPRDRERGAVGIGSGSGFHDSFYNNGSGFSFASGYFSGSVGGANSGGGGANVPNSAPPSWLQTSGVCLGGCHGTTPDGPIRRMTPTEEFILNAGATLITLPLGGEFVALARGGLAVKAGASGSRALVPAVDAVYATATERVVAGYDIWGNAARVGSTYNVNVLGLYATEGSQGLGALVGALRAEAAAAGASRISIQGLAIVNEGVAGISARAAARYGLQVERINADTIILTGGL
jgi:RHS repeat-associated protein